MTLSISGGEGLLDAGVAGEAGEVAGAHGCFGEQAEFAFDEVIREEIEETGGGIFEHGGHYGERRR